MQTRGVSRFLSCRSIGAQAQHRGEVWKLFGNGGLALVVIMLCGCVTQTVRVVDLTPPDTLAFTQTEAELLDVGIAIFDANVPDDFDERVSRIIMREIRSAEAQYIPFVLKNLLQSTGNWGAVRVVPRTTYAVDLTVNGRIIESDGEILILAINVVDATGKTWINKEYKALASKYAYEGSTPDSIDAFQTLYKEIANDMSKYRERLPRDEVTTIRQTAELAFAESVADDAFTGYLRENETGDREILRLPANDDPMLARIRQIREREYLFIDTLDEHYARFYQRMYPDYQDWRRASYNDAIAFKALKAQSRARIIGGTAAILSSVGAIYQSDNAYVDASGVAGVGAGATLIMSGLEKRQQAEQFADRLREVGTAAEAELVPTTIELENETFRLSGNVAKQYQELRAILQRLYFEDMNLAAPQPDGTESVTAPSGANDQSG